MSALSTGAIPPRVYDCARCSGVRAGSIALHCSCQSATCTIRAFLPALTVARIDCNASCVPCCKCPESLVHKLRTETKWRTLNDFAGLRIEESRGYGVGFGDMTAMSEYPQPG